MFSTEHLILYIKEKTLKFDIIKIITKVTI
jgi:hypothetical protein